MKEDAQFEAELKSGISADAERIRKKDEIIVPIIKSSRRYLVVGLLFLTAAAGLFVLRINSAGLQPPYWGFLLPVLLVLPAVFCFYMFSGNSKLSEQDLRGFYEEGLLVGALVIKTEPLTLMALSNLLAYDGVPNRYGCYNLVVHELEGAKGELYEKIPCSCFFRYESGNYHEAFQPHPLYWGTEDLGAIEQALERIEHSDREESEDTWGIIRRVAEEFPDLKNGQIVILNENYEPVGKKFFWQTDMDPLKEAEGEQTLGRTEEEAGNREYCKKPQQQPLLAADMPGKEVYERFVQLACRHQVYDYISGHCKNGSIGSCEHPGFFNYIGDPVKFPQELHENKYALQEGEYPLFMEKYLATTRGFYRKKKFITWRDAEITVKANFLDVIKVYVNGNFCTEFSSNIKGYEGWEQLTEEDKPRIAKLEAKRVEEFLQDIKENGI